MVRVLKCGKEMKVLWFTNTPSLYDQGKHFHHGGGWIESLEHLFQNEEGMKLGVSFFHDSDSESVKINTTTYFPILRPSGRNKPIRRLIDNWTGQLLDYNIIDKVTGIINDFQPDIIHVFGTEGPFATIQDHTDVPVIIHLQGLINPCLNAYFPVNSSALNFLFSPPFYKNNITGTSPLFTIKRFKKQAKREEHILRQAKYVMGRTEWDQIVANLYNPGVKYFHIDEVLRKNFYGPRQQKGVDRRTESIIISILSSTMYKGIDVLLRSAKELKNLSNQPFLWKIIGLDENDKILKYFEGTQNICHRELNITCLGSTQPEELTNLLATADVFVHPSYIDNSPNSVCEAQIMGLPVIACNVGGVGSLIEHGKSGFLVPANGVFEIVHYLKFLANNREEAEKVGTLAKQEAEQRHDRNRIIKDIRLIYSSLL